MKTVLLIKICLIVTLLTSCSGDKPAQPSKPPTAKTAQLRAPIKVNRKLLLLGVDGADWEVMDPLIAAGKLPNFKKLIDTGVRAPLKTILPTASPLIWTSIATGVTPEVHGVLDFTVKIPDTEQMTLFTSNMRKVKALWNILSEAKYSVGVIGWWATHPAEKVNGFVISDQADALHNRSYEIALGIAHDDQKRKNDSIYPTELAESLEKTMAQKPFKDLAMLDRFFKIDPQKMSALKAQKDVKIDDIFSIFKTGLLIDQYMIGAGIHALKKQMPDFTAYYLSGLDHAAEHHFWKWHDHKNFKDVPKEEIEALGNVVNEYYIYMDETLGQILEACPKDDLTVIVVSDHGHEPNKEYDPNSDDHYNKYCSGGHKEAPDGILIMQGKDIAAGKTLTEASVYDITPTVLALMGVPVAQDMVGKVLEEAIAPEFIEAHKVGRLPSHSKGYAYSNTPIESNMSDDLKKKLQGLGYIQ